MPSVVIGGKLRKVKQLLAPYENDLRTLLIVSSARIVPYEELDGGMEK